MKSQCKLVSFIRKNDHLQRGWSFTFVYVFIDFRSAEARSKMQVIYQIYFPHHQKLPRYPSVFYNSLSKFSVFLCSWLMCTNNSFFDLLASQASILDFLDSSTASLIPVTSMRTRSRQRISPI